MEVGLAKLLQLVVGVLTDLLDYRPCTCKMSTVEVDSSHLQFPTCRSQSCSMEVRCTTCSSWTDSQWMAYDSCKKACMRKVGAISPFVGGSSLTVATMQAEVHEELVLHASQLR